MQESEVDALQSSAEPEDETEGVALLQQMLQVVHVPLQHARVVVPAAPRVTVLAPRLFGFLMLGFRRDGAMCRVNQRGSFCGCVGVFCVPMFDRTDRTA